MYKITKKKIILTKKNVSELKKYGFKIHTKMLSYNMNVLQKKRSLLKI